MTSKLILLSVFLSCMAGLCTSVDVQVPVNGNQVPVSDVNTAPPTPTSQSGGDPTVSDPGETFTGNEAGGSVDLTSGNGIPAESGSLDPAGTEALVTSENDPVGDLGKDEKKVGLGKRRQLLSGRKMLGALQLGSASPTGAPALEAGNDEAGATATAFGHGDLDGPVTDASDNHIEPHGVEGAVTTAGEDTPYSVEANPSCPGFAGGNQEFGEDCTGATVGK